MQIRNRIKGLRHVPASELRPSPKNWRTHPKAQQEALRGILAEVGIAGAAIARELEDGSLELIDGHLRAETLPNETLPVLVLDVDEAEAAKLLATYDPLGAMAEADAVKLDAILREVDTGSEALQEMLAGLADDAGLYQDGDKEVVEDEVPETPENPVTQPGDLWILGEHRLVCGDSTCIADVTQVMAGEKARLICTDPPYGVDFAGAKYNPRAKAWAAIDNDTKTGTDLQSWLVSMWGCWLQFVYQDAAFYSWCAAMEEGAAAAAAMRLAGIHIQSQIIWAKNCLVLGQADYQWMHENCWYGFFKGKQHRWLGGRAQTTVWQVKKVGNTEYVHPMQKPVELYAKAIMNHTGEGDIVAEPFAGSGTQFIAAEQLGRRCFGMEIAPKFCDVIVTRWENLTGKKAERQPQ